MTLLDLLPSGLSGQEGIEIIAGVANFLALLSLYRALVPRDAASARARAHAKRRAELRTAMLTSRRSRRNASIGVMRQLLERFKLTRGEEVRKASERLAQAGWRTHDALTVFLGLRFSMPFVLGAVSYVIAPHFVSSLTFSGRLVGGLLGFAIGIIAPSALLKNAVQRRWQKIQIGLPDALDLFVICAEAGLSLDAAMSRVAREIGPSCPELADEFGLTAIELGFLPDRREALTGLTRRVDMASIRGLVNALVQTERYGTPLAQSLRVLAGEFRNTRMMKAEEKAARLPAVLTIPTIVFILPPLFAVLIGPAIIQVIAVLHKG